MKLQRKHILLSVLLPIQIGFIQFLKGKPQLVEHYYSNSIYPTISKILRTLFGWLPFSFGDALGIFLLIVLLQNVFHLFKNRFKNILPKTVRLTASLSVLYFCFYFFWGLNYFREPLAKNLNLTQSKYTTEQLITTTKIVIHQLNKHQLKITKNDTIQVEVPYTADEIYKKSVKGYTVLSKTYPQFVYEIPSVKSSLVSLMQSYNGTSGYINPITNEAQINNLIPKTAIPVTTCHEIAHQIGWSAENDANFIGFLTSVANDDEYFKYSGYRMALNYCLREVRKRDKEVYKQLWKTINKGILKDFNASYLHWKQYKNPIEPYIKKGYSSYLKANKQTKGIDSYSYVVDLLIAYFTQNEEQFKI